MQLNPAAPHATPVAALSQSLLAACLPACRLPKCLHDQLTAFAGWACGIGAVQHQHKPVVSGMPGMGNPRFSVSSQMGCLSAVVLTVQLPHCCICRANKSKPVSTRRSISKRRSPSPSEKRRYSSKRSHQSRSLSIWTRALSRMRQLQAHHRHQRRRLFT